MLKDIDGKDIETGTLSGVEVFSVGEWSGSKKVAVNSAMLDEIVANFYALNKKTPGYGVPVKLGHKTNAGDPAFGWMSEIARTGDTLVADFTDVPSSVIDAIGKRRYNSVSIELWPEIKSDGTIFKNVLGGVALLGAEWPAVKGLKPLSASKFSEGGESAIELSMKENPMLKFTQEDADALVLAAETRVRTELAAQLATAATALTASELRATTAEAAVKAFKAEADTKEFAAVIDLAIKEGKLLDKNRAKLDAMAATFMGMGSIKVGDVVMTPLQMFKDFVAEMPARVRFGEQGGAAQSKVGDGVAKASTELAQLASAKQAEAGGASKMSYETAVGLVLSQNPELKARYAAGE